MCFFVLKCIRSLPKCGKLHLGFHNFLEADILSAHCFIFWFCFNFCCLAKGNLRRRGSRQVFVFDLRTISLTFPIEFSSALFYTLWESLDLLSTLLLFYFFGIQIGLSRMERYWLTGSGLVSFLNVCVGETLNWRHLTVSFKIIFSQSTFPIQVFFTWILGITLNFFFHWNCVSDPEMRCDPAEAFFQFQRAHMPLISTILFLTCHLTD